MDGLRILSFFIFRSKFLHLQGELTIIIRSVLTADSTDTSDYEMVRRQQSYDTERNAEVCLFLFVCLRTGERLLVEHSDQKRLSSHPHLEEFKKNPIHNALTEGRTQTIHGLSISRNTPVFAQIDVAVNQNIPFQPNTAKNDSGPESLTLP